MYGNSGTKIALHAKKTKLLKLISHMRVTYYYIHSLITQTILGGFGGL